MQASRGLLTVMTLLVAAGVAVAQPLPPEPWHGPLVQPAWRVTGECYPIDFDEVDLEWYGGRGVYQVTIRGMKPYTNMDVSLNHESYQGRPAYWRTVVVGCVKNGLVMPITAPYNITMVLDNFVGTAGVEIVGASRAVRKVVPRS